MSKKKKYITRSEAAAILDVRPQSISNYIERGLIRKARVHTNDFAYVLLEDVEALKPEIVEIVNKEEAIEEFKIAIRNEYQALELCLKEQRNKIDASVMCIYYIKQLFEDCYHLVDSANDSQPMKVLLRILEGAHPHKIAEEFNIPVYSVKSSCKKALKNLQQLPNYEVLNRKCWTLESELKIWQCEYRNLFKKYNILQSKYQKIDTILNKDIPLCKRCREKVELVMTNG